MLKQVRNDRRRSLARACGGNRQNVTGTAIINWELSAPFSQKQAVLPEHSLLAGDPRREPVRRTEGRRALLSVPADKCQAEDDDAEICECRVFHTRGNTRMLPIRLVNNWTVL